MRGKRVSSRASLSMLLPAVRPEPVEGQYIPKFKIKTAGGRPATGYLSCLGKKGNPKKPPRYDSYSSVTL